MRKDWRFVVHEVERTRNVGRNALFFVPFFVPFGWFFVGTFCVKNSIGVTNGVTNGVTKLCNKMRELHPIIQKKLPSKPR